MKILKCSSSLTVTKQCQKVRRCEVLEDKPATAAA